MSKIEWTERTWNPIVGCSVTSPGCTNCYAMKMAGRLEAMTEKSGHADQYLGTTKKVKGKTVWTGKIGVAPDAVFEQPLRRKKPTTYFVNSMGDLFHPNVPEDAIDRVFAMMALSPQHKFQILTKYPERMRDWMRAHTTEAWGDLGYSGFFQQAFDWPYFEDKYDWLDRHLNDGSNSDALCCQPSLWPHVALGVSVEDQKRADERIPFLLNTPAAKRFLSVEPMLGPIDLTDLPYTIDGETIPDGGMSCLHGAGGFPDYDYEGQSIDDAWVGVYGLSKIDWVIVGGESGGDSRPMHPDWARKIRDDCAAAGVQFFFKQWGAWLPWNQFDAAQVSDDMEKTKFKTLELVLDITRIVWNDVGRPMWLDDVSGDDCVSLVGKNAAGRLLDGVEHNETIDWGA